MNAYNINWLDALAVKQLAGKWLTRNWLNEAQHRQLLDNYPEAFYTPNLFVRVGLFLFTTFLTFSAIGLASLFFSSFIDSGQEVSVGILGLLYGAGTLAGLEYFIRAKNHYRSGIDDALLYFTLALFIGGLSLIVYSVFEEELLGYFVLALHLLVVGAIRYADRLVAFLAFACLLAIVFLVCIRFTWGRLLVSFVIMAVSAGVYWVVKKRQNQYELRYWNKCLMVLEWLTLLTFYLSGNYLVVREGNALLNDTTNFREYTSPATQSRNNQRDVVYAEIQRLQEENTAFEADTLSLAKNQDKITANQQRIEVDYQKMSDLQHEINDIRRQEREKQAASGLPFTWFFYCFTFLLPLFYLWIALRRKDRVMLWVGMALVILAVLTYKYYFSLAPLEVSLTVAGTFLIAVAYLAIRWLKTPLVQTKYGLTYQEGEEDGPTGLLNAEALLIAQTVGPTTPAQPDKGFEFGRGDFGGGGAGDRY